jgi:hypothetical protein
MVKQNIHARFSNHFLGLSLHSRGWLNATRNTHFRKLISNGVVKEKYFHEVHFFHH